MKDVLASYTILPAVLPIEMEVLRRLEEVGRTCYKSEDKITTTSSIAFINGLKERKHEAMIEHYLFVLELPGRVMDDIMSQTPHKYLKYVNCTATPIRADEFGYTYRYILSGSARAFRELFRKYYTPALGELIKFLQRDFPVIFGDLDLSNKEQFEWYEWEEPGKIKLIGDTSVLMYDERLVHEMLSVRFICDRGVTHEQVRHRPCSYGQESTRYCNYSKDKFDSSVSYIDIRRGIDLDPKMCNLPQDVKEAIVQEWVLAGQDAERHYFKMLELGATPQIGRSVLNNSTKTEIVVSAVLEEWEAILTLRTPISAHPQMRELMVPLLMELKELKPSFFDNVGVLYE